MNKISKNVAVVVFTGILNLILTTLLGFVVSKFFDYNNYAYYKMYYLYINFVGFAHLGFINGIYLEYGKYDYLQLPFNKFHTYFVILLRMQIFVMICAIPFVLLSQSSFDKKLALLFVFANLPLINVNCFFSLINQFTKRFTIDSVAGVSKGILDLIIIFLLVAGILDDYFKILSVILFENGIVLFINIYHNKEIVLAKGESGQKKSLIGKKYITKGFFVMFSEFIGLIILDIDSLFAERFFELKTFAIYSFAVTIIALFYAIISTVSNLIYPYLVRVDYNRLKEHYIALSEIILIISIIGIGAVNFVCYIIRLLLPNYIDSIRIIYVLALTIPFKALIILVNNNFFKVMKLSKTFFASNAFAFLCSIFLNYIFVCIYSESISLAIASVVTIVIWYIILDVYFFRRLECQLLKYYKKYLYIIIMLIGYWISVSGEIWLWIIYFIAAVVFASLLFYKDLKLYGKERMV